MTIADILAKVRKGDTLTAEEKTFLEGYDPQRDLDGAAAAARKKAEADASKAAQDLEAAQKQLTELQAKLAEAGSKGKTDLQKLQEQVATLTAQIEAEKAEKTKLIRVQKLDDVIRRSGVQFVQEVDGNIMRRALESEFGGLSDEDLASDVKVKPVLDTFRARNKAVILDTSGHGSGGATHDGSLKAGGTGLDGKPVDKMTAAERQADLKKRGIL